MRRLWPEDREVLRLRELAEAVVLVDAEAVVLVDAT